MFELVIGIAAVIAMVRIADAEDQSRLIWGAITVGLIAASLFVRFPSFGSRSPEYSRSWRCSFTRSWPIDRHGLVVLHK
jgi:hypothetical protein